GDRDKAIADYRQAHSLSPGNASAREALRRIGAPLEPPVAQQPAAPGPVAAPAPPAPPASKVDADCSAYPREPDRTIRGCTRVIEAGQLSKGNLAPIYALRAHGYQFKGELDRAIADFDQAIRLMAEAPSSWQLAFMYFT